MKTDEIEKLIKISQKNYSINLKYLAKKMLKVAPANYWIKKLLKE